MSTRARACCVWLILLFVAPVVFAGCRSSSGSTTRVGRPLTSSEQKQVSAAISLMRKKGLAPWADQASAQLKKSQWKAALDNDPYIAGAEKAGDTPYAYTLPDDNHPHSPIEIVFAKRFFTDADTTAQAALMIHEMGHWRAFVATGKSDEYDGYKAEYDTHKQLGFGESDNLPYFAMLDGVVEYVVPRAPAYKNYPDVKDYIAQSGG